MTSLLLRVAVFDAPHRVAVDSALKITNPIMVQAPCNRQLMIISVADNYPVLPHGELFSYRLTISDGSRLKIQIDIQFNDLLVEFSVCTLDKRMQMFSTATRNRCTTPTS